MMYFNKDLLRNFKLEYIMTMKFIDRFRDWQRRVNLNYVDQD